MIIKPDESSPYKLLGFAAKMDGRDGTYEAGPLVYDTSADPEYEEVIYINTWLEGADVASLAESILTWHQAYAAYIGQRVYP